MNKIAIAALLAVSSHAGAQNLNTVAHWEARFQSAATVEYNTAHPQSTSGDSWQFYNLAYSIDANTSMFQATGNTRYLDRALLYVNNMIAGARPSSALPKSQFKDSYLGWANHSHPSLGNDGKEYPLFESFAWRYVTTLLRIIKTSPKLLNDPRYSSQYQQILAFSEKHIVEKWQTRGANSYIYRQNIHMASHWARIGMDLGVITDNSRYWTIFNNFNHGMPNYKASMRSQMRAHPLNPGAWWWNENWTQSGRPGQDVSHGNAVIAAMVEAQSMCQEYTVTDMAGLVKTFGIVWPAAKPYPAYLDGSGSNGGWFNDGFVKLGRFDAGLQKRLESHQVGQNTQLYGNGALNARILLAGRPVYPEVQCSQARKLRIDPAAIRTSAPVDGLNVVANLVDGNLASRWSGYGNPQSLTIDLGAPRKVGQLRIAFFSGGSKRSALFDVLGAATPGSWTPLLTGKRSAPGVDGLQRFDFKEGDVRYIRIVGHGNSANLWNSYAELEVWGQ
ncbi:discoidin domain-containing protein [Massilia sp. CF038]|uniref:discoidin domain-containing protein n=1 Tax=Massilia sp. CF038 TaxID=1881045 RepID=UPI0009112A41|nr:discoidin domain-containing protein [Massilia sp. CF038]SHG73030.1 F5/8 type C domain-containing protein [Massilia sp. CF038]